jgi:fatty acid elongase 3
MVNHWFLVACNSFVHIFVYGYFALSTMGYTVTWKKYITLMQIGQFVADIAYAIMLPVHMKTGSTNGDYGPFLFGNFIGITFIALFSNVYLNITRASKPTPPAC